MKFKIGDKVKILDYRCYITDKTSSIPSELMIHGNCMPRINHNATVVDAYGKYYIVNFINQIDEVMQLGYTEDNLELVSDEFILPEKWCILNTLENIKILEDWRGHDWDSLGSDNPEEVYGYLSYDKIWSIGIPDGYTEITFDQFKKYVLKDTVETIEKPKFKVGKWYKFIWKWDGSKWYYGQFDAYGKSSLMWSIWFRTDGSNLQKNAAFIDKELGEYSELTDLSEIQQYLPDGHPDKIKPMKKNEFKKGDYIVTLKVIDDSTLFNCGRNNYCFKQRADGDGIFPEVDLQGSRQNGHVMMSFHKNGYLKDWRYATPEEIAEYDRLGKPYDVTTLIKKEEPNKSLVGRYLKVIEDYANGTRYEKDDYIQIVSDDLQGRVTCNKNYSFGQGAYDWNNSEVELMPEGFVPPTESKAVPKSPKTEDLIDEARRRYPVGTKFHPSHVSKDHRFCVITSDCVFIENSEGIYSKVTTESSTIYEKWVDNNEHPQYGNCAYDRYVYTKETGKWAEIVSEDKPEKWEPKVGDWVMISEKELPITSTWLGEGGRIKHQGPFLVEKIENACVRKMSGIAVLLSFGRFRKAEPHEIPKTEEPGILYNQAAIQAVLPNKHLHMAKPHKYTAEEALAELKRRGFKKGVEYVFMYEEGTYDKSDICTANWEPKIQGYGDYIDCGRGYLWSKENPTHLHEGPISEPTKNLCGEIVIPNIPKHDWVAPPTFQTGTSYQVKHNNTPNYSKPETLLTKTTLNY